MMRFSAMLATLGFAVALVQSGDAGKKDTDPLQGKWTWSRDDKGKIELTFADGKFTLDFDGKASFKGTVKTDGAKTPKHIDLIVEDGPDKKFVGKTSLGIFSVEGDSLKWCAAEPGNTTRPAAFPDKEGEGGMQMYMIMKRAK